MTPSWLLLVVAASGCSLVYDADDLRAGRDGGASADADPDALFVARVAPDAVLEGEGSAIADSDEDSVRPIPIVLVGQNMTSETVFTMAGAGLEGVIDDVAVSGDGRFAAFALRVPILDDLADGDSLPLRIQLDSGDEETNAPLVQVTGLDELEQAGGGLDTDELNGVYTHVILSGDVAASGTAPLRIVATAGISISGTLRVDAGGAPAAGPGGCPGGDRATDAECGNGSGRAGQTSATTPGGGGGGGYGTVGFVGEGGDGEPGGMAGQRFVVPLPPAEGATAHGAGGGGGGDNLATGGGRGGGSGGVMELTTPAILTLASTALLSAAGGDGDNTLCATGGGGGGGSGGAILLRAGMLLATAGASAVAPGGNGRGENGCTGGDGGKGRIRIDRGNDADLDTDPAAFIGATPVVGDLPVIVSEGTLAFPVRGDAGASYQVFVGESETPVAFDTDGDGLASPEVTLEPGLNRLCVQAASGADLEYPEAKNCVNVAYIKP